MKTLLMVAFHFPPLAGSSGIQRTLRFVQQLPQFGWQPLVLTAHPRAYEQTSDDLLAEVPAGTVVSRAFALDTARHLSIAGRYPGRLARPDRWMSWRIDAVRQGLRLIREHRPEAIWSTYPIATAHSIGAELRRRSGLPWVADFRDPMAQPGYPADARVRDMFVRIEEVAALRAAMCIFATPGAMREYQQRYPSARERMFLLENGYDEASFATAEGIVDRGKPLNAGAITLLHSGIVYPEERDPGPLLAAVRALLAARTLVPDEFRLRFRAPVHEALLRDLARAHGIADVVEVMPAVPYRDALAEMLRADGLLLLQSNGCNDQVPAKFYEYLRARRPVLCLADPEGDTAKAARSAGLPDIVPLEDRKAIAVRLAAFVDAVRQGRAPTANPAAIAGASRQARSAQLAAWLEAMTNHRAE